MDNKSQQPETVVAPQSPPAYYTAPNPANPPQTQGVVSEIQPEIAPAPAQQYQQQPIQQQQQQQQQALPVDYNTKQAEAMAGPQYNGVPMVTPLEMLQGTTPQYIDCPWCHQRALVTTSRHGTPMQWLTGALCCIICVCLACVPCIAGWFEETEYSCSACKRLVAKRDDDGLIQVFGPPVLVPSGLPVAPQPVYTGAPMQQPGQVPVPEK